MGAVGELDHGAGVAAGRSGFCGSEGGDAELFEGGAHIGVFDPGGFVGDSFEVEGCAGWKVVSGICLSKL